MAYELATPAIQAALIARLEADAALAALLQPRPAARGGGPAIYEDGDVFDGQLMPYLTIGLWTQTADHLFSCWGWTCTGQIKAISQRISHPPQVMSAVLSALEHGTRLELPGYDSAWIDEISAQPMFRAQQAGKSTFELPIIVRVNVSEATAPVVVPPSYADLIVADGASHYWRLDETSGTTAADAIGGGHGTISGGVTLNQAGPIPGGKSMAFDGSTGKIVTAAPVTIPVPHGVIEAWIKTTNLTQKPYFTLRPDASFMLRTKASSPAGVLEFWGGGGSFAAGSTALTDGNWHHVVVVVTSTDVAMYVDGSLDTTTAVIEIYPWTGAARIGFDGADLAYWNGSIAEVAIYPTALTPEQIAVHHALGTGARR